MAIIQKKLIDLENQSNISDYLNTGLKNDKYITFYANRNFIYLPAIAHPSFLIHCMVVFYRCCRRCDVSYLNIFLINITKIYSQNGEERIQSGYILSRSSTISDYDKVKAQNILVFNGVNIHLIFHS